MAGGDVDTQTNSGLIIAAILFLSWSSVIFLVRVWVKTRSNTVWRIDDSILCAAFASAVIHVVLICISARHEYDHGLTGVSLIDYSTSEKFFYGSQIFYVLSTGLTRVSMAMFVTQLALNKRQVIATQLLLVACVAVTGAYVFIIALRGDLAEPWRTLNGTVSMFIRWLVVEVSGLALDTAIWALAVRLIWYLNMPVKDRLLISVILGVRFLLIPLVALRLLYLSPSTFNTSTPFPSTTTAIYTEAVMELSIILSSVTCAKPFLRPFDHEYSVSPTHSRTRPFGYLWKTSGNPEDSFEMISKQTVRVHVERGNDTDTIPFNISADTQSHLRQGSQSWSTPVDTSAQSLNRFEQNQILQTTDWTIAHEDRDDGILK